MGSSPKKENPFIVNPHDLLLNTEEDILKSVGY